MNSLAGSWWSWMTAMSVQIVLVVAVVVILDRLVARRSRPRLATALWMIALAKLLLPPTLGSPVSPARLAPDLNVPAAPGFIQAAFWTWIAGVVVFAAVAIARHRRWNLRVSSSLPGPLPGSRIVAGLAGPCVFGFFRPVILLPDRPVSEAALRHEQAHVARRDPLRALGVLIIQILYWFHPAAWLIRSRLETLREVACDARASRGRPEYRRMLLEAARERLLPAAGVAGLAIGRSRILERIEWLSAPPAGRSAAASIVAVLLLAACVPLARPAAAPFVWPTLDQAQGCLQRRFVVMEALSREPESLEKRP